MWRLAYIAVGLLTLFASAPVAGARETNELRLSLQAEAVLTERLEVSPDLVLLCGSWSEQVALPVEPELTLVRTGFACMDEEDFPSPTVDSEEVDSFYDFESMEGELSARIACGTWTRAAPGVASCLVVGDLTGRGMATATVHPRERTIRIRMELVVKCPRCWAR